MCLPSDFGILDLVADIVGAARGCACEVPLGRSLIFAILKSEIHARSSQIYSSASPVVAARRWGAFHNDVLRTIPGVRLLRLDYL